MKKAPKDTMTVRQAYEIAIKTNSFDFGDGYFAMIGWKSPDNGRITGPFFVTIEGDTAIEVDRFGRYVESYTAKADCYFPWVQCETNAYNDRVKTERGETNEPS